MAKRQVYPPTYLLGAIVLMIGLHFLSAVKKWLPFPYNLIGLIPLGFGIAANLWASNAFGNACTTVKPDERSTHLLTGGFYRVTRHPMYVGMVCLLVGIWLLLGSVTPVIPLLAFAYIIRRFMIMEEAEMAETFGQEYRDYAKRVRRWL